MQNPPERTITQIELPVRTIVRVILVFCLIWLLGQVWNIILLAGIALMATAALDPPVRRLQARGLKRTWAVAAVVGAATIVMLGTLLIIVSPVITEGQDFIEGLPAQVDEYERYFDNNPQVLEGLQSAAQNASTGSSAITGGIMSFSLSVVSLIADAFVVIVFTIYFLLDGGRIYRWCVRYTPPRFRRRMDRTIPEVSRVVSGYVTGQFLTSTLMGIFAFIVLTAVGVPQALLLALLAAIGDAIPIVGITAVTIPTVLVALTVSPTAAIIVLAAYLIYQQVENYVVVPRIYKTTLDISSFAVLLSILVGSALLGIVGALLALPIAAAIPVIEDIWLEDSPLRANVPPPVVLDESSS